MKRVEIKVKLETKIVKFQYPGASDWVDTRISDRMKLGGTLIKNVRKLLDEYLDTDDDKLNDPATTWAFRPGQQQKIGMALCEAAFGDSLSVDKTGWIHFVPAADSNEKFLDFFCRIPWILLTEEASGSPPFLAVDMTVPVIVTVDASPERLDADYDINCRSTPRLLVVMPEVEGSGTDAEQHLKNILSLLGSRYDAENPASASNIKAVRSWRDFVDCMLGQGAAANKRFDPDMIYFYGHGSTEGQGTSFQFDNGGASEWKDVADIADIIRRVAKHTRKPPFVWFNACSGAAANQDSALRLLSSVSSCVIAMRSIVRVRAGQELAEATLKGIIVDRLSPPMALRAALPRYSTSWMQSAQWASVVISVQFTSWTALGDDGRVATYVDAVGNFPSRVDRRESLGSIYGRLSTNLQVTEPREPRPKKPPIVLAWYGAASQAPSVFEDRVRDLLIERLPLFNAVIRRVSLQALVRAQPRTRGRENQLRTSIVKSLSRADVAILDNSPARVVALINGAAYGSNTVLALLHGPLENADVAMVSEYITLWKTICAQLEGQPMAPRIVLGFSFEDVTRPDFSGLYHVEVLGTVPPGEIAEHLERYSQFYGIAPSEIPTESQALYELTDGALGPLIESLEQRRDKQDGTYDQIQSA